MPIKRGFFLALCAAAPFFLTACISLGGPGGEPTRHFTLQAVSEEQAPQRDGSPELTVGVGPISLPSYLQRPQIVTLHEQNEYALSLTAQWGEPLEENVKRLLAANLRQLLTTDQVVAFPWRRAIPIDIQATADIQRFDAGPNDRSSLAVNWTLLDGKGNLLEMRQSRYRQAVDDLGDPAAVVAAMSRLLADFSRELATAIKRRGGE